MQRAVRRRALRVLRSRLRPLFVELHTSRCRAIAMAHKLRFHTEVQAGNINSVQQLIVQGGFLTVFDLAFLNAHVHAGEARLSVHLTGNGATIAGEF